MPNAEGSVFIHPQALVESDAIGAGTRVWAFAHVLKGAVIGRDCNICDGVFVEGDVRVGDRVTVKCGVQLWDGVTLEDDAFIGPNATFTNDMFPRSRHRPDRFLRTTVGRGASIGANATLLPGITVGAHAMVGAGAVVVRSVPERAIVVGNPARVVGHVRADGSREMIVRGQPRIVELPLLADARGALTFGQVDDHLPFVPRRYFTISEVPAACARGAHAHRECAQFLVALHGRCTVMLDDGQRRTSFVLDSPTRGLYVPPMTWNELSDFAPGTIVLCLASEKYDESDYIRDHESFRKLAV